MSLEYKTQAYVRRAIRLARIERTGPVIFTASLPQFGLTAMGGSRDEAEHALLTRLIAFAIGAQQVGYRLPVIDGVDLNTDTREFDVGLFVPDDEQWFHHPEWLAGERQASEEIEAGQYEVFSSADDFLAALPN